MRGPQYRLYDRMTLLIGAWKMKGIYTRFKRARRSVGFWIILGASPTPGLCMTIIDAMSAPDGRFSLGEIIAIYGAGVVASLILAWLFVPPASEPEKLGTKQVPDPASIATLTKVQGPSEVETPKIFTDKGPKEIFESVDEKMTAAKAQLILEKYEGMWMRISSTVDDVYGREGRVSITIRVADEDIPNYYRTVWLRFSDDLSCRRAMVLSKGDSIFAVGKIIRVSRHEIELEEGCFSDSPPQ